MALPIFWWTSVLVKLDRLCLTETKAVRSGLALSRFLGLLSLLRLSVADVGEAELDDDLAQARRWLGQDA